MNNGEEARAYSMTAIFVTLMVVVAALLIAYFMFMRDEPAGNTTIVNPPANPAPEPNTTIINPPSPPGNTTIINEAPAPPPTDPGSGGGNENPGSGG